MKGLRAVAQIMSVRFVKASRAIQEVVNGTLEKVVSRDHHFIEGASSSLIRWIRAVHPAIDGLGRGAMAELRLRSDARRDGMRVAWEILDPYGMGEPGVVKSDPLQDIIIRAFAVARQPTELAMIEVHEELAPVTSEFVPPGQERVFLGQSLQHHLFLRPGSSQHGSESGGCADPGCAGDLGSLVGNSR